MTESCKLGAVCEQCGHQWQPFGDQSIALPVVNMKLTCPQCNHSKPYSWYDEETSKMLQRKKLGLLKDKTNATRISELEKRITILEQLLELEKKRRELAEADTQWIKEWANRREKDFEDIDMLVEEEKERQRFRDGIGP